MPTSNFCEIYNRHRGSFWLQGIREEPRKNGPAKQITFIVDGPFDAEEAHEEARLLVNDLKDTVIWLAVFSQSEGSCIGAIYRRGERYEPWSRERERGLADAGPADHELAVPGGADHEPATALLPTGPEPVRTVDPAEGQPPTAAPAPRKRERPVRAMLETPAPKQRPTKLPGDRFPAVRGRSLQLGQPEGWPPSPPAQLVRAFFGEPGRRATVAEIIQALSLQLKELGVEHPAAMVSRLKQAGLLREVAS